MPKEEEDKNKIHEVDVEDELLNSYKLDDDMKAAARVHAAGRALYAHRQKLSQQAEENEKKSKKSSGWRKMA